MYTTIMIGFADALSAPAVAWSLLDTGFRVVAFGRRGTQSAARAGFAVPKTIEVQNTEDLRKIEIFTCILNAGSEGLFGLAFDDRVVAWSGYRQVRMMNTSSSSSSDCMSSTEPGIEVRDV